MARMAPSPPLPPLHTFHLSPRRGIHLLLRNVLAKDVVKHKVAAAAERGRHFDAARRGDHKVKLCVLGGALGVVPLRIALALPLVHGAEAADDRDVGEGRHRGEEEGENWRESRPEPACSTGSSRLRHV